MIKSLTDRYLKTTKQKNRTLGVLFLIFIILSPAIQTGAAERSQADTCILRIIADAPDEMTIGEARSICASTEVKSSKATVTKVNEGAHGIIEQRMNVDKTNILKPFTLMSHDANYILLGAHNFKGWNSSNFEEAYDLDSVNIDKTEVQFQLSIKTPLAIDLFQQKIDLYAAYTVRSFWQFYNHDVSSPFRETNHEPEIWLQFRPDWELFGFKNSTNIIGLSHQSNGQAGPLSRSWNRIYMGFGLEKGNFALAVRPWLRIEEETEDDDNPDITDFLGHAELMMSYKYDKHTFSLMTRNNLESGFSKGAIQLGWSFPLFQYDYIKGYVQYFSGYGESLIDYNQYVNRIGIGFLLTDVL